MPETIRVQMMSYQHEDLYYNLGIEGHIRRGNGVHAVRVYDKLRAPHEFPADVPLDALIIPTPLGQVRIAAIPLETARYFVTRDTRGRATLEVQNTRGRLVMTNSLDEQAWQQWGRGSDVHVAPAQQDSDKGVSVLDLSNTLSLYRDYATNHRMRIIRERLRRSVNEPAKANAKPVRSGTGAFVPFLETFKLDLEHIPNPFDFMEVLPHGTRSSRLWGIEVEAVDIAGIVTPKYWVLKDDGSLRAEPFREMQDHLDSCLIFREPLCGHSREEGCTNDCNCGYETSSIGYTETGEWNSPVLRSFHSRGLEHICSELEGRQTNYSAGIHVHIEATDLTPEQVAQVSLLYTAFEPLFESEYQREERNYCRSVAPERVLERLQRLSEHQKAYGYGSTRTVPGDERYLTVNINSLASHGTIEFRAMGNRYEYEFLIRWAHFLRELVNMARANVPQSAWSRVRNFKGLVELMSVYGRETPTPAWAKSRRVTTPVERIETLGTEARRAPNRETRSDDGLHTVFEDYSAREVVLS